MKLFRVGGWKSLIEEVEVLRANEKSFWTKVERFGKIKEERSAKITTYVQYFDTIEEAKAFLTKRYLNNIEVAKKKLAEAEANLKKLSEY